MTSDNTLASPAPPPEESFTARMINDGLNSAHAHAAGQPGKPITTVQIRLICSGFRMLTKFMSRTLDRLHHDVLAHAGLSLEQRLQNLHLHWSGYRELDVLRETMWILGTRPGERKWSNPPPIPEYRVAGMIYHLKLGAMHVYNCIRLIEKSLLDADPAAKTPRYVAVRKVFLAFSHYELTCFLYQSTSARIVFYHTVNRTDFPHVLLGILQPPLRISDTTATASSIPTTLPSAATKPAQQATPDDATCFVCWDKSEPNYDIEKILRHLDHERITAAFRRPFPDNDTEESGSLTHAPCCAVVYHRACLFQAFASRAVAPSCPHCQQLVHPAVEVELVQWKASEFSRKTQIMQRALLEEHSILTKT